MLHRKLEDKSPVSKLEANIRALSPKRQKYWECKHFLDPSFDLEYQKYFLEGIIKVNMSEVVFHFSFSWVDLYIAEFKCRIIHNSTSWRVSHI